jgi:hypothetical protein
MQRRNAQAPFERQGGSNGEVGDSAGAVNTCGQNVETVALSGQHFIDDRFSIEDTGAVRAGKACRTLSLDLARGCQRTGRQLGL